MTNQAESDYQYRVNMELPMEALAFEIFGDGDKRLTDPEIAESARKSIKMLKEMLIASGLPKALVDACMKAI